MTSIFNGNLLPFIKEFESCLDILRDNPWLVHLYRGMFSSWVERCLMPISPGKRNGRTPEL